MRNFSDQQKNTDDETEGCLHDDHDDNDDDDDMLLA